MIGLTYEDIFATKGIEYLLVLTFLVAFVLFLKYLNTPVGWLAATRSAALRWLDAFGFDFAKGIYYTPSHCWLTSAEKGTASIGIDAFLRRMLGVADRVELPESGKSVRKGEPLFSLIKGEKVLVVPSPVEGTISGTNGLLRQSPNALSGDPWVLRLYSDSLPRQLRELKSGNRARRWMAEEFGRLRDFFTTLTLQPSVAGQTLLDGGLPVEGSLEYLDSATWEEFSRAFLREDFNAS